MRLDSAKGSRLTTLERQCQQRRMPLIIDLGQDKRTILFDVMEPYALSGRSLNGVVPGVKTWLKPRG